MCRSPDRVPPQPGRRPQTSMMARAKAFDRRLPPGGKPRAPNATCGGVVKRVSQLKSQRAGERHSHAGGFISGSHRLRVAGRNRAKSPLVRRTAGAGSQRVKQRHPTPPTCRHTSHRARRSCARNRVPLCHPTALRFSPLRLHDAIPNQRQSHGKVSRGDRTRVEGLAVRGVSIHAADSPSLLRPPQDHQF